MFRKKLWIPGIKRRASEPRFFVWGKHRSFSDYIAVTGNNTAIQKLAAWAQREKTVMALTRYARNEQERHWYYWMVEKKQLHLGLMTTSRDMVGRPSLLIISGCGPLMATGRQWEHINTISAASRRAMMGIAREEIRDMPELNRRLAGLPWPDTAEVDQPPVNEQRLAAAALKIRRCIQADKERCLNNKTVRVETVNNDPAGHEDPAWPAACRQVLQMRPNSMFWGTANGKTTMILFFRQIVETDFIDFWEKDNQESTIDGK